MGLFSNRRSRKSSPTPNGSIEHRTTDGPSVRSRGRNGSHQTLPLTSPTTSSSSPRNGGSNLLLFGGHYYPGKDKKRRVQLQQKSPFRRRRLKNHYFWNSRTNKRTIRRIVILLIATASFLMIRFVFWNSLIDYRVNRQVDKHWINVHDPKLQLTSLKEEREAVAKLEIDSELAGQDKETQEFRRSFLQRLVPQFAGRNHLEEDRSEKSNEQRRHSPNNERQAKRNENESHHSSEKEGSESLPGTGRSDKKPPADKEPANVATDKSKAADSKLEISDKKPQSIQVKPKENDKFEERQHKLRTLSTMADYVGDTNCPSNLADKDVQVTLVTQSSLDRLWILEETCQRWHGPIVNVVPLPPEKWQDGSTSMALNAFNEKCPQLKIIPHQLESSEPHDYPVNILRNVGLNAVESSHVLMTDIDFVPSQDLDSTIHDALLLKRSLQPLLNTPPESREAVIVPAFERVLPEPCPTAAECKKHLAGNSSFIPHSFENLQACVKEKGCIVFQSKVNWEGHFTTDSETWLAKNWFEGTAVKVKEVRLRDIRRIDCFDSLRYEPYVVLKWCPSTEAQRPLEAVAPYYDERFYGYGKNKISYIQHLRVSGYRFSVLPQGFLVHNPHVESDAKEEWNKEGSSLHHDMDTLYPKFLKELAAIYQPEKEQIVGMCSTERQ